MFTLYFRINQNLIAHLDWITPLSGFIIERASELKANIELTEFDPT